MSARTRGETSFGRLFREGIFQRHYGESGGGIPPLCSGDQSDCADLSSAPAREFDVGSFGYFGLERENVHGRIRASAEVAGRNDWSIGGYCLGDQEINLTLAL